ncbi:hypothetical protein RclHR1_22980001 [Rhizophagus clarus]|nr:hypothetical protein RclHR1_22980001 [Rhizophagus clarus]
MVSNKRALAIVALLIISVVIKTTLSSPTDRNFRSLNLHKRQAPTNDPPKGGKVPPPS